MKKIIAIFIAIFFLTSALAQSLKVESSFNNQIGNLNAPMQKLYFNGKNLNFRFDHYSNKADVMGIIIPKFYQSKSLEINFMAVKSGNHDENDRYALDLWGTKYFNKFSLMLDVGRLFKKNGIPWDFVGGRLRTGLFTIEGYQFTYHPMINNKLEASDPAYAFIAFHPNKLFLAYGLKEKEKWFYLGSRNLSHFGNFTVANYNPENNNFWIKSQTAFGQINQDFYNLDTYLLATEYLTIPLFFHLHLSPIAAKGTYALKLEAKRVENIYRWEIMAAKKISQDNIGLAIGLSGIKDYKVKIAPSFEVYKIYKISNYEGALELRYDMATSSFLGYLVIKY